MRLLILIAGLLAGPMVAAAEPAVSIIDMFYSKLDLEADSTPGSVDDANLGARAWVGRAAPFLTLDYQDADLEGTLGASNGRVPYEAARLGVGFRFVNTAAVTAWARTEFLDLKIGQAALSDENGYGIHGGARFGGGLFNGHAEIGFIGTDNTSGNEIRFGGSIEPANYGFFFEVRRMALDVDIAGIADLTFLDSRLGARWNFY